MHTAHDTNIATACDGEGSSDCFCTSIISSLCMYLVGHTRNTNLRSVKFPSEWPVSVCSKHSEWENATIFENFAYP